VADDLPLLEARLLLQASLGEHRGIAALAERLAKDPKLASHHLYELARGCAVAHKAAGRDDSLSPAEKEAAVKRLAGAALGFLRRAGAGGYFQEAVAVRHLMDEADFATLRPAGDFKDLVKKLQSRGKGPAGP
jgi:hypothetical protein